MNDRPAALRALATVSLAALLSFAPSPQPAHAQVTNAEILTPNKEFLFREDSRDEKDKRSRRVKSILSTDAPATQDLDVKAPNVEYLKEKGKVRASGGVLVSRGGTQAQGDEALVDIQTKDVTLKGNILVTDPQGAVSAEQADFNLETETGRFEDAELEIEDGSYEINSEKLARISEDEYELFGSSFSTCHCDEGDPSRLPWQFECSRAHITRDGYAHTYGTKIKAYGVPMFYLPYFPFPVKQERQSGLLTPRIGNSSKDGFKFDIPAFFVIDDQTDITLHPFIETQTRVGSSLDFRRVMSTSSRITSRFYYSDESRRDGSLRGTNISGIVDPSIDDNRVGGFLKQIWRNDEESDFPTVLLTDIHYISDDLFLREIDDKDVGPASSRFSTSTAVLRTGLTDYITAEIAAEYNQGIYEDDDLTFQRLPEGSLSAIRSFRPFGFNPLGLKLVSTTVLSGTEFYRERGFDGLRTDINPRFKVPLHYKNYFNSELGFELHHTNYNMDDETIPGFDPNAPTVELDTKRDFDTNRTVGSLGYTISTALERVFEMEPGNPLTFLSGLGVHNQELKLARVKHTVEPFARYAYVPDVDQDDLPLYDSLDRIRPRSLFTYGLKTSLYGRYLPVTSKESQIPELTPRVEDIELFDQGSSFSDVGFQPFRSDREFFSRRLGEIREIVGLTVKQSYDNYIDQNDTDDLQDPFSDVLTNLLLYPSKSFAIQLKNTYNVEDGEFTSWGVTTHLQDDRGDAVRARLSYVEDRLSQVEGNLELVLTERVKVGYYSVYDELASEFIENSVALRLMSACDCWHLDLGYSDKINPDKQQILLSFTFTGLGDISQGKSFSDNPQPN